MSKSIPGCGEQLQRLKDRGFVLIVVTNQPDVARGTTPRATVEGINDLIAREIPAIDRFIVCFHDNNDCLRLQETPARNAADRCRRIRH